MENFKSLPALALAFIALLYIAFGIMFMIAPQKFSSGIGFPSPGKEGIIELRAVYGGLELALGGAILYKIWSGAASEAAFLSLVSFIGFGGGRLIALSISGLAGLHIYFLIMEFVLGTISWLSYQTFKGM